MRPPRRVIVFSRDELQRSEWSFAISHHSPSKQGVHYSAEATGDLKLLAQWLTLSWPEPRALILCARDIAAAAVLLSEIGRVPPTVVVTPKRPDDWPTRPANVSCATHERWVVFEHLDVISNVKHGPKKRDQCQVAGVPFFFKQSGAWLPSMQDGAPGEDQHINCSDQAVRVGKKAAGALLDGREWHEFPRGGRP